MGVPKQRDLDQARARLTSWLGAKLGAGEVAISDIDAPATTGFSNETLLFDAAWTEGGREHSQGFAVRVKPGAYTIFLESAFETQYRVLRALSERTQVPVPPTLWYEDDASVLVGRDRDGQRVGPLALDQLFVRPVAAGPGRVGDPPGRVRAPAAEDLCGRRPPRLRHCHRRR